MKRLIATIAALCLLAGCGAGPTSETKGDNTGGATSTQPTQAASSETSQPTQEPADDSVTATFKVTTTGKASVMWGTTSGTSKDEIGKGSWSKKLKLKDTIDAATLIVTSVDFTRSQTVTCEILINGVSKAKNDGKGKLSSASCTANTMD